MNPVVHVSAEHRCRTGTIAATVDIVRSMVYLIYEFMLFVFEIRLPFTPSLPCENIALLFIYFLYLCHVLARDK